MVSQVFRSMRFPAGQRPGSVSGHAAGAGFVVTSGFDLGRPVTWVARRSDRGICMQEILSTAPNGPCRLIPVPRGVHVVETGPGTTVVGAVSRRARWVDALLAGGETVAGRIVPAPPILRAQFDFFVVELPLQSRGRAVARDAAGRELGEASFDPPPLPVIGHGGVPGRTWVLLDREQEGGVRCIDFDKGLGDQGSLCPTAVPSSRDVQAGLMPLRGGRNLVVGVVSKRVAHVQVQYMNSRFVAGRLIHLPTVLLHRTAVLPASYHLFVASIGPPEGAAVVAFDRAWHPIDGLPLSTGGGSEG